ncbi:MAG: PA2169 family four-helix-bundle protein [Verrucomicrobia bacterium]|nr:PA2169 family four-helix-bundle protein [Verrucomicrobiota bacterium]
MRQQKAAISTINNLIETLKDGEKGFKEAADSVRDPQLKSLFRQYSQQRHHFASELQAEAQSLGSTPEKSSSTAGAMHRAWINLKSAVTSGDDKAILAECERGEDSAVHEFEEAMRDGLTGAARELVSRQFGEIKSAHDRVRQLRDAAKKI